MNCSNGCNPPGMKNCTEHHAAVAACKDAAAKTAAAKPAETKPAAPGTPAKSVPDVVHYHMYAPSCGSDPVAEARKEAEAKAKKEAEEKAAKDAKEKKEKEDDIKVKAAVNAWKKT